MPDKTRQSLHVQIVELDTKRRFARMPGDLGKVQILELPERREDGMNTDTGSGSRREELPGTKLYNEIICAICGTPNRAGAYYCKRCAVLLVDFCPRCRVDLPPDADFCDNCAYPLTVAAAAQWPLHQGRPVTSTADEIAYASLPVPHKSRADSLSAAGSGSYPAQADQASPPPIPSQPDSELQRLMPRELAAKLESARSRDSMQGERRVVTALLCDVKGSTAAAEQLDPEDWTEIINGGFEHMIRPVYRYEGTIARLMGDAIVAFFGAPIAHEDDPERAVLAGLDIVAGIAHYREQIRQQWGIDFNVRVGINTGLVVVGEVGSDLHMEYTALGDAINVAARMEQSATPGSVQIAYDTYRLIRPLFEFEDLGDIEVKGKSEPIPAYRVLRKRADADRTRGIEGLEAELIGRSEEMARLEAAIGNLRHGVGGIITLMGAAGLGKSRMIQELKTRLQQDLTIRLLDPPDTTPGARGDAAPIEWIEIGCLSYESNHPYALLRHLFRRLNGVVATDGADRFWEKVMPLAERFPPAQRARALRAVATLFGLPDPSGQLPLEGEHFKRELFAVFSEVGQLHFDNRPTLLVLDDLHWADAGSIELLLYLLPTLETSPVMWLCAFRPDRDAPCYRLKQLADGELNHRHTGITVRPLSAPESDALVNRLLSTTELPLALRTRIQERAGGNPFFIEEVVRSLIESGALIAEVRPSNGEMSRYWRAASDGAEIEIPDNLQGLIYARIDRLPTETKEILQMAAVIGRSFYYRVLAEIGGRYALPPLHVEEQIGRLVRLEMIQEVARVPEVEYRFRNLLTQEIAYRTILNRQRRELHGRAGEAMEALFSEQVVEVSPRLAFHFGEAQQASKALHYYALAGDNAFRLFANVEAAIHYAHALECAESVQPANQQLIHLYRRRGRALELTLNHVEAFALYQELEALGSARQDDELRLAGIMAQATIYYTGMSDLENARLRSEEALALARALGDQVAEARSLWNLLLCLSFRDPPRALQYGMDGLQIARALVSRTGVSSTEPVDAEQSADEIGTQPQEADAREHRELLAFFLQDLVFPLIADGQLDTAFAYANEARESFEQVGNLAMAATSLSRVSMIHWHKGRLDEAIATNDRAVEMDRSIGNEGGVASLSSVKLFILPLTGEFDRFFATWEAMKVIWQRMSGFLAMVGESFVIAAYAPLGAHTLIDACVPELMPEYDGLALMLTVDVLSMAAQAYVRAGNLDRAQDLLERCRPHVNLDNLASLAEPSFVQAEAELALASGQVQEALDVADAFLQRVRPMNMAGHIPAKLLVKGKALHQLGRIDDAAAVLREGYDLASGQPARTYLWEICAELAILEEVLGNHERAEPLRQEACATIQFISDHAGRDDLRATFLARPDVRKLLDGEAAL